MQRFMPKILFYSKFYFIIIPMIRLLIRYKDLDVFLVSLISFNFQFRAQAFQ